MRHITDIVKNTKYSELEIEKFWAECYVDFLYFAEHVLGFDIADYHREWYELVERYRRLAITAFRGSGKTHFFAAYFLWYGIFNPKKEFMIISHKERQARQVLKEIRKMIVDNEILSTFVPQNRESTWQATELELVNGSTYFCKPYNENVRSWHPDFVLCDEAGEYEDKSIYWTAVLGAIQLKRGRVVVIGTPKSSIDLLSELKENEEYFSKEYPAEVDGKVLWTQKYTLSPTDSFGKSSLVRIRREMGELPYTQEYLLIPISSANSLFPLEITTKCVDDSEEFLPYGKKNGRYYLGYDIASSPKGDYTVMVVLDANEDRKKIAHALRFRDTFEEQKKQLTKIYNDFQPIKMCVDGTGLGDQQAKELAQTFSGVEVVKFTYDTKFKMLLDLRQEFERYSIVIPASKKDLKAYSFSQELLKELNDFALKVDIRPGSRNVNRFVSGEYDDCAIALALANKAAQNMFGTVSIRSI